MADFALRLWYDFKTDKSLVARRGPTPLLTRATEATFFDSAGVLQTAASGVARFDHNPLTLASLGLLPEKAGTNLAIRSGDTSNAVWVASNITKETDSVADPTGSANTNVRLTASAGNGTLLQTITSAADNYIYSVFMKRVTGTGDIDLTLDNGVTWTTKTLTSAWTRFDVTDPSETNPVFGVRIVTSGDAIDFWGSDVNKDKLKVRSHIPTVASSVTRNQDTILTNDVSFLDAAATVVGTFFVVASVPSSVSANSWIYQLDDGGGSDKIAAYVTATDKVGFQTINSAGDNGFTQAAATFSPGAVFRHAARYANDDIATSLDGGSVSTDASADIPLADNPTRLFIGKSNNSDSQIDGHIQEVRYYNVDKGNDFTVSLAKGEIVESLVLPPPSPFQSGIM